MQDVSDDARTEATPEGVSLPRVAQQAAREFHVQIPGSSELRDSAWIALKIELESFGDDVLQEAGRIEDTTEDISARDIKAMASYVRRGYAAQPRKKRSRLGTICEAFSYVTAIFAGIFVNNITEPWGSVGLVIAALLGIFSFIWARESGGRVDG
ncbi:hypothetical protein GCM10009677_27550 [Sphaerisporangium rubeum]|uniref:DUF2335 domain-containing protein n=1 Tax=Sphaerisporangium rubeum TaxID=321317 RepID=A0A7X0M4V2_9ACTN|nr:hypothetical protein [Sphaerisporangium rubeum]MBB6471665.1 hypothetical protein [Sphaerisporangium rubeum]